MVREATKFLKNHSDKETVALYRTFVINETGEINQNSLNRAVLKLNYKALAAQATEEILELEAEAKAAKTKQA